MSCLVVSNSCDSIKMMSFVERKRPVFILSLSLSLYLSFYFIILSNLISLQVSVILVVCSCAVCRKYDSIVFIYIYKKRIFRMDSDPQSYKSRKQRAMEKNWRQGIDSVGVYVWNIIHCKL